MEPQFRSSFIPKKPLPVKSSGKIKKHRSFNLVVFLSGIVFVVALGAAGAAFAYERIMQNTVDEKGAELSQERNRLDLARIEEYQAVAARLDAAEQLVTQHTILSDFFTLLNEKTLHNIAYTSFAIREEGESPYLPITLSGQSAGFNPLTVQTDVFRAEAMIENVKVVDISLNEEGGVSFELQANLVKDRLRLISQQEDE